MHSLQRGQVPAGAFAAAMGIGCLGGMTLGLILGLFQFNIGRGVLMGASVGAVIGLAAGALALLTSDQILAAATAMTAGSGLGRSRRGDDATEYAELTLQPHSRECG